MKKLLTLTSITILTATMNSYASGHSSKAVLQFDPETETYLKVLEKNPYQNIRTYFKIGKTVNQSHFDWTQDFRTNELDMEIRDVEKLPRVKETLKQIYTSKKFNHYIRSPRFDRYKNINTETNEGLTEQPIVMISLANQVGYYIKDGIIKVFLISSGAKGVGTKSGSGKTAPGLHYVNFKFGSEETESNYFKGGYKVRNIYYNENGQLVRGNPEAGMVPDMYYSKSSAHVTSGGLTIDGLEGNMNSSSIYRGIKIHGTNKGIKLGMRASGGCIRTSSKSIIDLVEQVEVNTLVYIMHDTRLKGSVELKDKEYLKRILSRDSIYLNNVKNSRFW